VIALETSLLSGLGVVDARADRFTQGEGALDLELVHHFDDAARVILDGRLLGDMIGMPMAGIVDGDGAEVGRQRL